MEKIRNNAAYIIKRINELWGEKPGKKTLQKIVFLIQEKGIDLNYDYGLHFYGPYSAGLDEATTFMSADGVVKFDYSGHSHRMSIDKLLFDVSSEELSPEQEDQIDEIINRFNGMRPSELELLATAIYAYNNLEQKTKKSVIDGVIKIKGEKYPIEQIEQMIEYFSYFGKTLAS